MKIFRSAFALPQTAYRLLQKIFTLDITHLMILHASDLNGEPNGEGFVIRFLTADEVRRFAAHPRIQLDQAFSSRITDLGHFCVGAMAPDGTLVAYVWFARDMIEARQNRGESRHSGMGLTFPQQLAFAYNAFTCPEFRGRGLLRAMNAFALGELGHRAGIVAIITTTDWTNQAALKSFYTLGFRYVGHIVRFGWPGMVGGIYPAVAAQYGIKFGTPSKTPAPATTIELSSVETVCS